MLGKIKKCPREIKLDALVLGILRISNGEEKLTVYKRKIEKNKKRGNIMGNVLGVFNTVVEAIEAADAAQKTFIKGFTIDDRERMIAEIRKVFIADAEKIAGMTVEESKLGRVDDKIQKVMLAATGTAGTEVLSTNVFSSHQGITIEEGAPYGVIGAITPVTNPTETILGNGISMIASGNAVVFNVHPSAKNVSAYGVNLINEAIIAAGGPVNLITMVKEPTMETMQEIAKSPNTKLLVGTGGPGLVKALLNSGKKVIAAGAGNPPVIIDETANIELAGATIVASSSFDNNLLCIGEKEVFVVDSVADQLINVMTNSGSYLLSTEEVVKVTELVFTKDEENAAQPCTEDVRSRFHLKKEWVGQDASKILKAIGVTTSDDIRNLIFETDFNNPFVQIEQMMPVLPIVRCTDYEEAIKFAVEAEHDNKHSAAMWSNNIERITKFGKLINTTIFVQNGATMAGIGFGGSGTTTATIATPTGEGITNSMTFTRRRRFAIGNGGNYIL